MSGKSSNERSLLRRVSEWRTSPDNRSFPADLGHDIEMALASSPETSCVGWIDCGERLPAHGLKVMAFYRNQLGKGRTVFAQHIEKFKDCADNYDYEPDFPEEFFDTDESGTSWVPEGWYEVTETHENNLQISDAITHWRPLLAAPEHPKTSDQSHRPSIDKPPQ